MAKTIQIIFVKANDLGIMIKGDRLNEFQKIHSLAIQAYKKKMGMLEKISGKLIRANFEPASQIDQIELASPLNRIIMIRDDGTAILLQDEAFNNYWEHHTQGMALLGKKHNLKGQYVRVN